MPFTSQAQRKFMYARHPKLAKEFESKTKDKELPEYADVPILRAQREAIKKKIKR